MKFDVLRYAWSDWGIRATVGFQAVTASEGLRQAVVNRSGLWRAVQRLCYLPSGAGASGAISTGWVPSKKGLFLFRRETAGVDGLGRSGAYSVDILYASEKPTVYDVLTLLMTPEWGRIAGFEQGNTRLSPIDVRELSPPVIVGNRPLLTDSLLFAILEGLERGQRVVVDAPADEVLDAVTRVGARLPVDELLARPLSTFESTETAARYWLAGCQGVDSLGAKSDDTIAVPASVSGRRAVTARQFFASSTQVDAALDVARPTDRFDARLFLSVLAAFAGGPDALEPGDSAAISRSVPALEAVLADEELTSIVLDQVLNEWQRVGASFVSSIGSVSGRARDTALLRLAEKVAEIARTGKSAPNIGATIKQSETPVARIVGATLADAIASDVSILERLTPETTQLALRNLDAEERHTRDIGTAVLSLPHNEQLGLAQDRMVDPLVRGNILAEAWASGDCKLLSSSLHSRDSACWSEMAFQLESRPTNGLASTIAECIRTDYRTRAMGCEMLESVLRDPSDFEVRSAALEARLLLVANEAPMNEMVYLLEGLALTPREVDQVGSRLAVEAARSVEQRVFTEPVLLTHDETMSLRSGARASRELCGWERAIQGSSLDNSTTQQKAAHATRFRLQVLDSSRVGTRTMLFVVWFDRIVSGIRSRDDVLALVSAADALGHERVWACVLGRTRIHVHSLAAGEPDRAQLLKESVLRASEVAFRSERKWLTSGLPKGVKRHHEALRKVAIPKKGRR